MNREITHGHIALSCLKCGFKDSRTYGDEEDNVAESKCLLERIRGISYEWKVFSTYFKSIHQTMIQGEIATESMKSVTTEVFRSDHLLKLDSYVRSIRKSTRSYVTIYNEQVINLVSAYLSREVTKQESSSFPSEIEKRYDTLLKQKSPF